METKILFLCPLCHNVVRPKAGPAGLDRPDLGRHLARDCTVRIA